MKVGDTVPVQIGQSVVAQAKIVEMGDGTATLVIPATRAVMSVVTRLDDTPVTPTGGTEHAILGVENPITGENQLVETSVPAGTTPLVEAATSTVPADGVTPAQPSSDAAAQSTPAVAEVAPPASVEPAAPVAVASPASSETPASE